jgi:hypothetical protein
MDTIILTSDEDDGDGLSSDEDGEVPAFSDPSFKTWWETCCRNYAEHRYHTTAQRVDVFSLDDEGKILPPSLFLIACETYRKNCFIEAWVEANKWVAEQELKFGDNKLYEKAEIILHMNADDIKKQLAGIKV